MSHDAEIAALVERAAALRRHLEALRLPRGDRARQVVEYELIKVRLELRELRARQRVGGIRRSNGRKLIPYAGADYK